VARKATTYCRQLRPLHTDVSRHWSVGTLRELTQALFDVPLQRYITHTITTITCKQQRDVTTD
jgi:hypothetical protein